MQYKRSENEKSKQKYTLLIREIVLDLGSISVYSYLLKKMSITEPDQVWCSDITYIRLAHGFVYVTA